MEYQTIKPGKMKVSRIGFGCAALSGYDYGKVDEFEAIGVIRKAWEAGVNLFDTADVYGFGQAEEMLSKALGRDRHDALIVTKFGVNWDQTGKTFKDCSPKRIKKALENSLRRLKIECIPVYMIHWHDGITPIPDIMEVLADLQKQGKIQYVGCSNFSGEMIEEASAVHKIDFVQMPYSLVRKENESDLEENKKKFNVNTMVYDALARGLLSGKYSEGVQFGQNDTRTRDKYFSGKYFKSNLLMVKKLKAVGQRHNKTAAQIALAWVLQKRFVDFVLVGSKRVSQLNENLDVFGWQLQPEDLDEFRQ